MKSLVLFSFALITLTSFVYAGDKRGGGDSDKVLLATIRKLVEDGVLKKAMLNYVATLNFQQIEDQAVRELFLALSAKSSLQIDIQKSQYTLEDSCHDFYEKSVPASTFIGKQGSGICFNVNSLLKDYRSLSDEQFMINLASLAFHEHVHHFQNPKNNELENENAAYRLASYVKLTAKTVQVPLLEWTPGAGISQEDTQLYCVFYHYPAPPRLQNVALILDLRKKPLDSKSVWFNGFNIKLGAPSELIEKDFRFIPTQVEIIIEDSEGNEIHHHQWDNIRKVVNVIESDHWGFTGRNSITIWKDKVSREVGYFCRLERSFEPDPNL